METHDLEEILRRHPFFEGLAPELARLVRGCARMQRFDPGRRLFREGQPAEHLYVLRRGRVALELAAPGHRALVFQTVDAGDIIGIASLVPPYRSLYDARAVERTVVIAIEARCIREKCESDPRLGYELMKRLVPVLFQRLTATRLQLLDVYGPPAR